MLQCNADGPNWTEGTTWHQIVRDRSHEPVYVTYPDQQLYRLDLLLLPLLLVPLLPLLLLRAPLRDLPSPTSYRLDPLLHSDTNQRKQQIYVFFFLEQKILALDDCPWFLNSATNNLKALVYALT